MSVPEKSTISLADLPACPVETTLTLISDKWKVLILRDLMPGRPGDRLKIWCFFRELT